MSDTATPARVASVCVQNAGRSQMSAVFAEHERERRGFDDGVKIRAGGTDPVERVHDVVNVIWEAGFDLSGRTPQAISTAERASCDYVATMGCSTLDIDADDAGVEVRDRAPDDPNRRDRDRVREIRDRVSALSDEIEQEVTTSV